MTLEYFIQKLEGIKPSEDLLIKEGFTGIHLTVIKKNYALEKKKINNQNFNTDALAERLISVYDAQYLRFNDYSFVKEMSSIEGFTVFCTSSHSVIGYKTEDGEIIECDTEEMSTLNHCAKNIDSFLKALLHFMELKSLRLQGLADKRDNTTNERYLSLCVSSAGGSRYLNFFKRIIF